MSVQIHPSDSKLIPDLRILPISLLVEHELNDDQRTAPLAQRLEAEGMLKNPPVVTPLGDALGDDDPRFVVLDGANRITALKMLDYPHILAQVVPYQQPQVTLTTWHHVIDGMDPKSLTAELTILEGVDLVLTDRRRARAGLARREYLMYVIRVDAEVFAVPEHPSQQYGRAEPHIERCWWTPIRSARSCTG